MGQYSSYIFFSTRLPYLLVEITKPIFLTSLLKGNVYDSEWSLSNSKRRNSSKGVAVCTTREEFWEVLQYYTHLSGHLSMSKLVSLMLALFFEVCICRDTTLLPN